MCLPGFGKARSRQKQVKDSSLLHEAQRMIAPLFYGASSGFLDCSLNLLSYNLRFAKARMPKSDHWNCGMEDPTQLIQNQHCSASWFRTDVSADLMAACGGACWDLR